MKLLIAAKVCEKCHLERNIKKTKARVRACRKSGAGQKANSWTVQGCFRTLIKAKKTHAQQWCWSSF